MLDPQANTIAPIENATTNERPKLRMDTYLHGSRGDGFVLPTASL
jgi:hypothetical protein